MNKNPALATAIDATAAPTNAMPLTIGIVSLPIKLILPLHPYNLNDVQGFSYAISLSQVIQQCQPWFNPFTDHPLNPYNKPLNNTCPNM